jgi:hypothetical protein
MLNVRGAGIWDAGLEKETGTWATTHHPSAVLVVGLARSTRSWRYAADIIPSKNQDLERQKARARVSRVCGSSVWRWRRVGCGVFGVGTWHQWEVEVEVVGSSGCSGSGSGRGRRTY